VAGGGLDGAGWQGARCPSGRWEVEPLYGASWDRWDRGPRVLRRWHLVVAVLAALVIGILIGATARGDDTATRTPLTVAAAPTTSTTAATVPAATSAPAPPSTRPPGEVRVLVLNGALQGGVAGAVTQALADRGYVMAPPGDIAQHPQTTVYERGGAEADCEAVRAAVSELRGQPAVAVPLLDPAQIPGAAGMDCVVVIGRALAALA